MSCVLSLYSVVAYREILLPATDDSDYQLEIQGNLFGLPKDVSLKMEILDGKWKILQDDEYSINYFGDDSAEEDIALSHARVCGVHFSERR